MTNEYPVTATCGGDSLGRLDHAVALISQCFEQDPAAAYWLNDKPHNERIAYHPQLFYHLLKPAALLGAYFLEANTWESTVVMIPPKIRTDSVWISLRAGWLKNIWHLGYGGCKRLIFDYAGTIERAKKRHMGDKPYFYIFQVATLGEHRGQGLSSMLLYKCTEIAQAARTPIWLEATTEGSKRVYERVGFKVMEHMSVGRGKCDANGEAERGGDGLTIWGMKWVPSSVEIYSMPYEAT
ncbi:hypothetical protein EJ05DRAFT_481706 [Pseudovirgaria hyperparasitica]|uniref:N-acetyltransferase domain-containing protein n=1 Tax=Pseudovirgaria hyperparasitica TaxID=470096 RepID=A0A6A6WKX4_9PEZI|nr:uncharacterized protein EJ05DRAFT_481706 [Pseudovirgaria hyperparasitica]KAF2762827.1 hypothetical protein EJ05DRAFT_481706 [Pseudovirgaria hyperparasitica]